MVGTLLALLVGAQGGVANLTYAYTGLPTFESNQGALELRTHSVTLTVLQGAVEGISLSELRNPSDRSAKIEISIPLKKFQRTQGIADVILEATWSGRALRLTPVGGPQSQGLRTTFVRASAYMPPRSSIPLRVVFRQPLGTAGLDGKLRVVGYELGGTRTIGQLNVALKYDEREVFRLPQVRPPLGWQVGSKGAFLRIKNFKPKNDVAIATFYPGGF